MQILELADTYAQKIGMLDVDVGVESDSKTASHPWLQKIEDLEKSRLSIHVSSPFMVPHLQLLNRFSMCVHSVCKPALDLACWPTRMR